MQASYKTRHKAFTLVELLVVIGILLIISALGVVMVPRFNQDQKVSRGSDQLQQYLLIAKQRAKRDLLPTGIRLYIGSGNLVNQIAYIQQPKPFTGGNLTGISTDANSVATLTFDPANVDLIGASNTPDLSLVQVGDYIAVSGTLHQIGSVTSANTLQLTSQWPNPSGGGTTTDSNNSTILAGTPTQDWQILRGPRRFPGEDIITLYQDMAIDVNPNFSLNLPATKTISGPAPYTQCIDILFAPGGGVISAGGMGGKMILWVRDSTAQNPADPGSALLVAIQLRAGFISAAPVASAPDPYAFTKDGRGSGL